MQDNKPVKGGIYYISDPKETRRVGRNWMFGRLKHGDLIVCFGQSNNDLYEYALLTYRYDDDSSYVEIRALAESFDAYPLGTLLYELNENDLRLVKMFDPVSVDGMFKDQLIAMKTDDKDKTRREPVKQIIIVRNDLKMRKGKFGAQVAHAAMKPIIDMGDWINWNDLQINNLHPAVVAWLGGDFTKVVLQVDSEDQLRQLVAKAEDRNIPTAVIVDNGKTEFKGEKTLTAAAIGPWYESDIKEITGHLSLF